MKRYVIFLNGPIGAGKTSLGLALAKVLGAEFLDGDNYADPDLPWFRSTLRTNRAIADRGLAALERASFVVIGYPLRCTGWIYHKRRFSDQGVQTIFVGLRAAYENITAQARGRRFTDAERARIAIMIAQGYGQQPFNDLLVDTDKKCFEDTLATLVSGVKRVVAQP